MPLRFPCPQCGQILSAPDDCAGRTSRCRGCGQSVTVPFPVAVPNPVAPALVPVAVRAPDAVHTPIPFSRWAIPAVCGAAVVVIAIVALVAIGFARRGGEPFPGNPVADFFEPDESIRIRMLRKHPFWQPNVTGGDIDKVLKEMSSHAEGSLFVNSSGKFVYFRWQEPLIVAAMISPEVRALGPNTVLVEKFPSTRKDCARVLNDNLSGLTAGQVLKQNDDILDGLKNMKLPDD